MNHNRAIALVMIYPSSFFMLSDFDIVFDSICQDVFPKLTFHIEENHLVGANGYVDVHECKEFLTDCEGYDTDMASKIWDCYIYNNQQFKNMLRSKADARS